MHQEFDWQGVMERTRRSSAAASLNSENAVAGVAKMLRKIDRLSFEQRELRMVFKGIEDGQKEQLSLSKKFLEVVPSDRRPSLVLRAFGLTVLFAVGVGFGAYIAS